LRGGYLFNSHIGVAIGVWGSSGRATQLSSRRFDPS
jgi:hypothetical protein